MLLKRLSGLLNRVIHESRKSRLRSIVDSAPVPEGALPESVEAYRAALHGDLKRAETILKAPGEERAREDRIIWFLRWSKVFRLAERGVADSPDAALWRERYEKERAKLLKRGGNPEGRLGILFVGTRAVSDVPEKLAHFLSLGVRSIEEYAFQSQLPDDLFNDLESLEETWAKNQRRLIDEERQVEEEGPAEDYIVFPDGWKWRRLMYECSEMEKRAMGHCGNCAAPKPEDEILSLREPIRRGARFVWKPHATFILNDGRLGEMKGFQNAKPGKDLHPYIVELLKDGELIQAIDGGGFLPENNFELEDLSPKDYEEVISANPFLRPIVDRYREEGMSESVWQSLKSVVDEAGHDGDRAFLRPEEGEEIPSKTGWYEVWRGGFRDFMEMFFPDHPVSRYGFEYRDTRYGYDFNFYNESDYEVESLVERILDHDVLRPMLLHYLRHVGEGDYAEDLGDPEDPDLDTVTEIVFRLPSLVSTLRNIVGKAYEEGLDKNLMQWITGDAGIQEISNSIIVRRWNARIVREGGPRSYGYGNVRFLLSEDVLVEAVSENRSKIFGHKGFMNFLFGIAPRDGDENFYDDGSYGYYDAYNALDQYAEFDEKTAIEVAENELKHHLLELDIPPWEGIDPLEWAMTRIDAIIRGRTIADLDKSFTFQQRTDFRLWLRSWSSREDGKNGPAYETFIRSIATGDLTPEVLSRFDAILERLKEEMERLAGRPIPWPEGKPSDALDDPRLQGMRRTYALSDYLDRLMDALNSPDAFEEWVREGEEDTWLAPLFREGFRPAYVDKIYVGICPVGRSGPHAWAYRRLLEYPPEVGWIYEVVSNAGLPEEEALKHFKEAYALFHKTFFDDSGPASYQIDTPSQSSWENVSTLEALRSIPAGPKLKRDTFASLVEEDNVSQLPQRLERYFSRQFRKAQVFIDGYFSRHGIPSRRFDRWTQ